MGDIDDIFRKGKVDRPVIMDIKPGLPIILFEGRTLVFQIFFITDEPEYTLGDGVKNTASGPLQRMSVCGSLRNTTEPERGFEVYINTDEEASEVETRLKGMSPTPTSIKQITDQTPEELVSLWEGILSMMGFTPGD